MNPGLALTSLSIVAAFGNIAFYYPKMMGNRVALRPRLEQSVMILALLLAGAGFFLQPGILGYVLGGIAIVPAGLFLFATAKSGLDHQQPAMAVAEMAPDFSATRADGTKFRRSDLRGSPVRIASIIRFPSRTFRRKLIALDCLGGRPCARRSPLSS